MTQGVNAFMAFRLKTEILDLHDYFLFVDVFERLTSWQCSFKTLSEKNSYLQSNQEAHHEVGQGETPRCLIRKCGRYSSLQKFEDAFDTAIDLMQTKPSYATFSAVFRTSINVNRKQLVTSYLAWL